jgi:peptidoglycan/xylan/chitin deacetylase (PgdA/CDA1 family)
VAILCYHSVDPKWRSPLAVSQDEFARQCEWLSRRRYMVELGTAVALMDPGGRLPSRVSALTFDDGFAGVYDHAFPILAKYRLPATVFVVAGSLTFGGGPLDWVEGPVPAAVRTLTFEQAREMQLAGVRFGSHGFSHRELTLLSDLECEQELRESRELLEDLLGRAIPFFAYPGGQHDERVRRAARKAGYQAAFTLPDRREPTGPFAVPRVGVYPGNDVAGLKVKTSRWYPGLRVSVAYPAARAVVRAPRAILRAG